MFEYHSASGFYGSYFLI